MGSRQDTLLRQPPPHCAAPEGRKAHGRMYGACGPRVHVGPTNLASLLSACMEVLLPFPKASKQLSCNILH